MSLLERRGDRAIRRVQDGSLRTEYLAFSLANELYAVKIDHVAEILKPPPVTEVPRASSRILGIVSVRGKLVTVVDLRRVFRLEPAVLDPRSRILLVDVGTEEQMGLLVDEVLQVYRLSDAEIEPASVLGGDSPPHIWGIGRPQDALLVILDLAQLLEE